MTVKERMLNSGVVPSNECIWVFWIFLGLILFVILGIGVAFGDGAANPAPVVVSVNRDIVPISK